MQVLLVGILIILPESSSWDQGFAQEPAVLCPDPAGMGLSYMNQGGLIKSFGFASMFLQQSELAAEESPEKLGTSQLHRRKIISLNKQILQKTKHLEEVSVFFL